jgi:predicted phosphoadenosine phosphosulfate sulfurtransferase
MSFSGGKDSLALAQVTMSLIQRGEIDPSLLTVQFVDEEAIFPCIEETVMDWRRRFLYAGAKFEWYCVEVKHFNCFNELSEEETFICWDKRKRDVWVRQPPPFAITSHPMLRPRKDNYQSFMPRVCMDGITMTGVRAAESVQRLQYMARLNTGGKGMTGRKQIFPIYDWTTNDVWLYLRNEGVEIPQIYLYLWQSGTNRNQLRVSQFFSVDTARSLVQMNEYYPDLMERIIRREPNAYLAALYWDSEMFGRRSRARRQAEGEAITKDYKAILTEMFSDMPRHFNTPNKLRVAKTYRNLFIKIGLFATPKDYQLMYEALMKGDPKLRSYRALYQIIYSRYIEDAKAERKGVEAHG